MSSMDRFMFEKVLAVRKKRLLSDLNLYLITDRHRFGNSLTGDTDFIDHVAACLEGGVGIVQLRESKTTPDRKFMTLAKSLRTITAEFGAYLIIAERADIAKAVGADGVHLSPDSMDVNSARKIVGHESIIGLSVYAQGEAEIALEQEIDYLTAGPVFASEMVPGQPAVGLNFLKWLNNRTELPWFAAGGIDLAAVPQVLSGGAQRIALTRALMASRQPKQDAQKLLDILSAQKALSLR